LVDYESKRYASILAKFKELGGCNEIEWNTTNIEKKLVEMGLEDMYMDMETCIRRRLRLSMVKRESPKGESDSRRSRRVTPFEFPITDELMSVGSDLTKAQEEELLDQIENMRGLKTESPHSPTAMDLSFHESMSRSSRERESARVARQECDKLLRATPQPEHGYYSDARTAG
jgi:hypothetical protein